MPPASRFTTRISPDTGQNHKQSSALLSCTYQYIAICVRLDEICLSVTLIYVYQYAYEEYVEAWSAIPNQYHGSFYKSKKRATTTYIHYIIAMRSSLVVCDGQADIEEASSVTLSLHAHDPNKDVLFFMTGGDADRPRRSRVLNINEYPVSCPPGFSLREPLYFVPFFRSGDTRVFYRSVTYQVFTSKCILLPWNPKTPLRYELMDDMIEELRQRGTILRTRETRPGR